MSGRRHGLVDEARRRTARPIPPPRPGGARCRRRVSLLLTSASRSRSAGGRGPARGLAAGRGEGLHHRPEDCLQSPQEVARGLPVRRSRAGGSRGGYAGASARPPGPPQRLPAPCRNRASGTPQAPRALIARRKSPAAMPARQSGCLSSAISATGSNSFSTAVAVRSRSMPASVAPNGCAGRVARHRCPTPRAAPPRAGRGCDRA